MPQRLRLLASTLSIPVCWHTENRSRPEQTAKVGYKGLTHKRGIAWHGTAEETYLVEGTDKISSVSLALPCGPRQGLAQVLGIGLCCQHLFDEILPRRQRRKRCNTQAGLLHIPLHPHQPKQ